MKWVQPKVYLLAHTAIHQGSDTDTFGGLNRYLMDIGLPSDWQTEANSGSEVIAEIAGRVCYRSWVPGMNANVTKVREGNKEYLANVIKQGHGSVLEHGTVTFVVTGCSRVFTHELVRHRLCAFSQESLRYVRLEELEAWYPEIFADHKESIELVRMFQDTFEYLEDLQKAMNKLLKLDDLPFDQKKKLTSAMRRLAPIGLATQIVFTTNHRNLRHMIEMRTSRHAEEEIRIVFGEIATICATTFPNIYADMKYHNVGNILEFTFDSRKI